MLEEFVKYLDNTHRILGENIAMLLENSADPQGFLVGQISEDYKSQLKVKLLSLQSRLNDIYGRGYKALFGASGDLSLLKNNFLWSLQEIQSSLQEISKDPCLELYDCSSKLKPLPSLDEHIFDDVPPIIAATEKSGKNNFRSIDTSVSNEIVIKQAATATKETPNQPNPEDKILSVPDHEPEKAEKEPSSKPRSDCTFFSRWMAIGKFYNPEKDAHLIQGPQDPKADAFYNETL